MPRIVTVEGCGPMACLTYPEVAAEIDRVYSVPRDEPLPVGDLFAAAREAIRPHPPRSATPEAPGPEPA